MELIAVLRKIRACEGEAAAQLVLEHVIREAVEEERDRIICMQADGLAALIRQQERQACAKVCDEMAGIKPPEPDGYDARDLAEYSVWEALIAAAMKMRSNVEVRRGPATEAETK